jgi:hypothetical protein
MSVFNLAQKRSFPPLCKGKGLNAFSVLFATTTTARQLSVGERLREYDLQLFRLESIYSNVRGGGNRALTTILGRRSVIKAT